MNEYEIKLILNAIEKRLLKTTFEMIKLIGMLKRTKRERQWWEEVSRDHLDKHQRES